MVVYKGNAFTPINQDPLSCAEKSKPGTLILREACLAPNTNIKTISRECTSPIINKCTYGFCICSKLKWALATKPPGPSGLAGTPHCLKEFSSQPL